MQAGKLGIDFFIEPCRRASARSGKHAGDRDKRVARRGLGRAQFFDSGRTIFDCAELAAHAVA